MGLFRVRGRLAGPTGRSEDAEHLVDTGATLLVVPRSLAERLGLAARRPQPVLIAGGQRAEWLWPK
jgi:predicted aspartyl protease